MGMFLIRRLRVDNTRGARAWGSLDAVVTATDRLSGCLGIMRRFRTVGGVVFMFLSVIDWETPSIAVELITAILGAFGEVIMQGRSILRCLTLGVQAL